MLVDYYKAEREQIERIAKENQITVIPYHELVEVNGELVQQAHANPSLNAVKIPDINSAESYSSALHEFGHILHPLGHYTKSPFNNLMEQIMGPSRDTLVRESAAWDWALKHTSEILKDWTLEHAKKAYASYARFVDGKPSLRKAMPYHDLLTK